MAEMDMELDSDYKFPLRRWLIRKIDRGEIRNLKWLDMPLRTLFKIPWNRQGHPDWEQEYKIFKDWAIHRGKNVEETDWTKMKANFRSVLNKSNDFEEVKDQRVEDQQTGNYRVYRLLTHVQVKEKTKRANQRKKIFKKSSSPLSKQCDILPSSCSSSSPQECTPNVAASILPECSQWSTNQSQDFAKNTIRSQSTYHLEISDTALPDENRSILLNQWPSRTMQSTQMPTGMSGQCQIYPDFSQLKETHYRQPSPPMQTPSFFEDSEEDMFLTAPLPNQKQKEKTKRANQRKKIFKKSSSPLSKQCDILPSSCSSSSPQECTPNVAASILPECSQWSTNQSQDFAKNTIRSQSTYHLEISDTALPDENRSILLNQGPSRTMQSTQMPAGMSGQCQIYPDFSQLKETHYRQPSPPMQTPSFFEDSEEDMFLTAPLPNQKQKEKTKRANQRKNIFKKSSSPLSKQCDILPSSCSSSSSQECTPMETELLRDVVMAEDTSRTLVPGESIFSYQASIQYNDQVVKEEVFPDLRQPYRIHYGSDEDQTLEALVKQDSLPPFLKQQAWPLPPQPERDSDKYVQTILNECDLGVVVRSDENGNIFAERLCKARIYVYEQELSSNDIIKLERREETQIFSHQVFKKELRKFREKEKTMAIPEGKVKIFFATVPHSRDSKGVVSLTLTSCVAAKIARNEVGILPQVEVSLSNSLDYLIKSTDLIQIANNKR